MKTAFLFTLLFVSNALFSQNLTEAELLTKAEAARSDTDKIKVYINLHNLVFKPNVDKSEEYARQILKYGKASNILRWENKGYLGLARCYRKRRQYNYVIKYDSLSLLCTQRSGNAKDLFAAKMQLAQDFLDAEILSKALAFLKECESISEITQNPAQIAQTQQTLGYYYYNVNQNTKSIPYFEKSIKAYLNMKNEKMTAECKLLLVYALLPLGRTDSIPNLIFSALEFYKKNNSQSRQADCYSLLGQSYLKNGNAQKGIENYLEAKHLHSISNNKVEEALATTELATAYLAGKDFKNAEHFAKEAEAAFTEMKYDYGVIMIKTFWGQFYSENNNYALSEQYFVQADKQAKELGLPDLQTDNQRYWTQQRYKQRNYKAGDSLMLRYAERVAKQREPAIIANDLKNLAAKNKNIDSNKIKLLALLYAPGGVEQLRKVLKGKSLSDVISMDSLLKINPFSSAPEAYDKALAVIYNDQLLEMEEKYKSKLNKDSLQIAHQEITAAIKDINKKNIILIAASIILLLLLIVLLLLNNNKRRTEADKKEIERLNKTIVHSTKNTFSIQRDFINIEKEKGKDAISLETMATRFSTFEILYKKLYTENPTGKIFLEEYLTELCMIIEEVFKTDKQISIVVNAPLKVNGEIAKVLGFITNEVVTNSFKHAFTNKKIGVITIEVKKEGGDRYLLKITDNGKGINEAAKNNGGMTIIRDYADVLDGNFLFLNKDGTQFNLSFPLKN